MEEEKGRRGKGRRGKGRKGVTKALNERKCGNTKQNY
jgi:hypothetical protein